MRVSCIQIKHCVSYIGLSTKKLNWSGKIVIFTLSSLFLLLSSTYSGLILSFMVTKDESLPVETLADIVMNDNVRFGYIKVYHFDETFRMSTNPDFNKAYKKASENKIETVEGGFQLVNEGNFVFLSSMFDFTDYARDHRNEVCRYGILSEKVGSKGLSFAFRKGSPYVVHFTKAYVKQYLTKVYVKHFLIQ